MKITYLALQADYDNILLGLWNNTEKIGTEIVHKMNACQQLMPSLVKLLNKYHVTWGDLSFIAVNQGPAPFTTLRIVVTTANALSFAHKIPLTGVDALTIFAQEYHHTNTITTALLNAFSQDLYFAIAAYDQPIETGCENNEIFLQNLALRFTTETITFIGNGADLFKEKIMQHFNNRAKFIENNPNYTNFEKTALTGYEQWKNNNFTETLLPLYLKIQTYKTST